MKYRKENIGYAMVGFGFGLITSHINQRDFTGWAALIGGSLLVVCGTVLVYKYKGVI